MHKTTLLFAFLALFTAEAYGQRYDFFSVNNGQLIWSRNYENDLPHDSLVVALRTLIQSKIYIQNAFENADGFMGELKHYKVDCARYGRKYTDTPLIYWSGEWKGRFVLQLTTKGYQVDVYDLYFENTEAPHVTRVPQKAPRKGSYIEEVWISTRNKFRHQKLEDMSLMSVSLKEAFDLSIQN